MTLGSNAAAKAAEINGKVHGAIAAYITEHGPDVELGALRSFVIERAGVNYAASTLARMLVGRGYVKGDVRKLAFSGKATFYVPGDPRRMPGGAAAAVLKGGK